MTDRPVASSAASRSPLGERVITLADKLAAFSETPDGLTCTFFTPAHRAAAVELQQWMREIGLDTRIDGVGNVIGRLASRRPGAKTFIIASHYDTVRNAGKYDGRLGILTGLVALREIIKKGEGLPFHVELIAFSEEEGVRFSAPYIGSSAIAGSFNRELLARKDAAGVQLVDLLAEAGFNPAQIEGLARKPQHLAGYIELHIEQGPVLLNENLPLGIVTGIAATFRFEIGVTGAAGHAGTTPMNMRRDAGAAVAEMILYVERRCSQKPGTVGTVGRIGVPGGAINVIPGRCDFTLDVRAGDDATLAAMVADIRTEFDAIAKRRKVEISITETHRHEAVPCSPHIQQQLAQAIERAGIKPRYLPSGAGHDAGILAPVTDSGMMFVRCGNGGVSHSPLETVTAEDVDVATRVLIDMVENFRPRA